MKPLAVVAVAVALLALAAACKAAEEAPPTSSAVATPSPEPTATPSAGPTGSARLVFIRPISEPGLGRGVLWVADADGSNAHPISPEDAQAAWAGTVNAGVEDLLYYVTYDGETARTLWEFSEATGQRRRVFSFQSRTAYEAFASVSPDGRYATFTDTQNQSVKLFDMQTGETRLLLQGNASACELGAGGCFGYRSSRWSPDGRLLQVNKGFYEGSRPVVIDPFAADIEEIEAGTAQSVWGDGWGPQSDAFCGTHSYGGTGLYLARAPSWEMRDLVPEYNVAGTPAPRTERYIRACDWLNANVVAFATATAAIPGQYPAIPDWWLEVSVLDLDGQGPETVTTIDVDGQLSDLDILVLPGVDSVLIEYFRDPAGAGEFFASQPELIDLTSGELSPILQEGDWVVGVVEMPTP